MPTTPRLYTPISLSAGASLTLSPEQAHYLTNVLRRGADDRVFLFNARDGEFAAMIASVSRKAAIVTTNEQTRAPAPERDVTLFFAPIKRGPMEVLVQKATELGATMLQPVITARTVAKGFNHARLNAIAVEAAEQCERLSVPELGEPVAMTEALEASPGPLVFCDEAGDDPAARWGGENGRARHIRDIVADQNDAFADGIAIVIGPEGGFTPDERAALTGRANTHPVSLGRNILRAETAAIVALAHICQ